MSDIADAAAAALGADGPFAVVTGRDASPVAPLVHDAAVHVISPGPTTRLSVAAGVSLGGHRAVTLLDDPPQELPPDARMLAFTASPACAGAALELGWSVVQPWRGDDVAELLEAAAHPALVLLAERGPEVDSEPPPPRRARQWHFGTMATLVASGAAVSAMVRLAQRLETRGVEVAAVEVAVLSTPEHLPLIGADAIVVGGGDLAPTVLQGRWPETRVQALSLADNADADLVGAVLALVPAV